MKLIRLYLLLFFVMAYAFNKVEAQGLNHQWLIGSQNLFDTNTSAPKAKMLFDLNNDTVIGGQRKMAFSGTETNISDENGNLLFASNGCWIADATGDTMMNGSEISPGLFTDSWNNPTTGLPFSNANLIVPFPGDSTKYVLFHQTLNLFAGIFSTEIYFSVIDMTLNGGLGGVISNQKNIIALSDTLSIGIAACKHSNGRDWWIIALKDHSNIIFKILFTPNGVASVTSQAINMPLSAQSTACQPSFSPDGTKFAFTSGLTNNPVYFDVRVLAFDRCIGNFDSLAYLVHNNDFGFGLSFSPSSKYLYYSSGEKIYQLDVASLNIVATDSIVALFDGYCYPSPSQCTSFYLMYLAANSKIYITSSNYVIDLNFINSPDSAGIACDVHQHGLRIPCYSGSEGINHPNYYLGCDTTSGCPCLTTSIEEQGKHNFKFSISPNPTSGNIKIVYLLPQKKSGVFEVFDINGKKVFSYTLPPWSTLQNFSLPHLADGLYNCVITSGKERVSKNLVVIRD